MATYREKEKWPFAKRVGHIRISSQDLFQLLENCAANAEVSATSKRHTFSSLEDIKGNLPLFVGEMELKIKFDHENAFSPALIVNLGACAKVSANSKGQVVEIRSEKIASELKHHRVPILGYLTIIPPQLWVLALFLLIWLVPSAGEPIPLYVPWLSEKLNGGIWLGSFVISILALAVAAFPPVFYNPRQTLWQKNRDKIFGGLVLVVLTWIARDIWEYLF